MVNLSSVQRPWWLLSAVSFVQPAMQSRAGRRNQCHFYGGCKPGDRQATNKWAVNGGTAVFFYSPNMPSLAWCNQLASVCPRWILSSCTRKISPCIHTHTTVAAVAVHAEPKPCQNFKRGSGSGGFFLAFSWSYYIHQEPPCNESAGAELIHRTLNGSEPPHHFAVVHQ